MSIQSFVVLLRGCLGCVYIPSAAGSDCALSTGVTIVIQEAPCCIVWPMAIRRQRLATRLSSLARGSKGMSSRCTTCRRLVEPHGPHKDTKEPLRPAVPGFGFPLVAQVSSRRTRDSVAADANWLVADCRTSVAIRRSASKTEKRKRPWPGVRQAPEHHSKISKLKKYCHQRFLAPSRWDQL